MKHQGWKAIAAMADNRVIGSLNRIPWHLPEDFKWFKQKTREQVVVMGRKTWESLGSPLPRRENIVLTRHPREFPGARIITSLKQLDDMDFGDRSIFIIGGAEIYRLAMPRCDELFITHVHGEFEGDTFFPPFEDQFALKATLRETPAFTIRQYQRIQGK